MITVKCLGCDQDIEADDDMAGVESQCPACGAQLIIPAPAAPVNAKCTAIKITCPKCKQELECEESDIGQLADCPGCGDTIELIAPRAPSAPIGRYTPVVQSKPGESGTSTGTSITAQSPSYRAPSSLPPREFAKHDPSKEEKSVQSVYSLWRLMPLIVCCLGFGWILSAIIGERYIVDKPILTVGLLAVPALILVMLGSRYFLQPEVFPAKQALGAMAFTMTIGVALLLLFQGIANNPPQMEGFLKGLEYIIRFIGWCYATIQSQPNIFEAFLGYIFGVGLCEESIKLIPLVYVAFSEKRGNSALTYRSFLIVGFFSGLGFGINEAFCEQYFPESGSTLLISPILRWFSVVPSHGMWSVIAAACLWWLAPAIKNQMRGMSGHVVIYIAIGWYVFVVAIAAIIHGIYDVLCGLPYGGATATASLIVAMFLVVRHVSSKTHQSGACGSGYPKYVELFASRYLVANYRWVFPAIYMLVTAMIGLSVLISSATSEASLDNQSLDTKHDKTENKHPANPELSISLGQDTNMAFVWIKALKMWVGKYEVSRSEYARSVEDKYSKYNQYGYEPVIDINFEDAKKYAAWINNNVKLPKGYKARLPSESEWLVYARCGDGRVYPWGNDWPPKYGNYFGMEYNYRGYRDDRIVGYNDGEEDACSVKDSGSNSWGLYGVGGNVWEVTASDATGLSFGSWRGASYMSGGQGALRCDSRADNVGTDKSYDMGFRIVLSR